MSGTAGYVFKVKVSGESTAFTEEACTNTTGDTWRITSSTKRVWDVLVIPTFYDDEVAIDVEDILSIDYLFGEVTFTSSKTGPITVSGSYMPVTDIAGANSATLGITSEIIEATDISNSGYHTKVYGLQDVSVSASRFDDMTGFFRDLILNRERFVIEINPNNGSEVYRGWFRLESSSGSLGLTSLVEEELSFVLDGDIVTTKSFGYKSVT